MGSDTALYVREVTMADGDTQLGVETAECEIVWISTVHELREEFPGLVPLLELYADEDTPFFTNWRHRWDSVQEARDCLVRRFKLSRWDGDETFRFVDVDQLTICDGRANVVAALRRLTPLRAGDVLEWMGYGLDRGAHALYAQHFADADRLVRQLGKDMGMPQAELRPAGWIKGRMHTIPERPGRCWLCGGHKLLSTAFGNDEGAPAVGTICAQRVSQSLRRALFLELAQQSLHRIVEKFHSELGGE